MQDQTILLDKERGVLTLTLNRPRAHNALDDAMVTQILEALDQADQNESILAVCLRANGPTFCAGIDIKAAAAAQMAGQGTEDVGLLTDAIFRLARLSKPTIAVVAGPAYGAGVGLIVACDFVLATSEMRLAVTQVRHGLVAGLVAPLLAEAIGLRAARQFALSARPIDAARALHLGLISEILEPPAIDGHLEQLFEDLRRGAPRALIATKALLKEHAGRPVDETALADIAIRVARQRADREANEGMAAFREKRPAAWVSDAPTSKH